MHRRPVFDHRRKLNGADRKAHPAAAPFPPVISLIPPAADAPFRQTTSGPRCGSPIQPDLHGMPIASPPVIAGRSWQ